MIRPLSNNDLYIIANYLIGTDSELYIALSELGYDPNLYPEMEDWLLELSIYLSDGGIWSINNE